METTFTEKQLIDFGNYLLSKERKKMTVKSHNEVSDADLANWKEKQAAQQ